MQHDRICSVLSSEKTKRRVNFEVQSGFKFIASVGVLRARNKHTYINFADGKCTNNIMA